MKPKPKRVVLGEGLAVLGIIGIGLDSVDDKSVLSFKYHQWLNGKKIILVAEVLEEGKP